MKKIKSFCSLFLCLALLAAVISGCGNSSSSASAGSVTASASAPASNSNSAPTTASHDEIIIKLGASSATTEPTGIAGQKLTDLINERLAGKVKVEYYPGEQLGAAMDEVENMQSDLQQAAIFSFDNYAAIAKDLNVMSMAFAFDSIDHVYAFLNSDLANTAFSDLENAGIHVVSYKFQKNPRAVFAKKPLKVADDLNGVKFRVPNLDIFQKNFSTLGAVPTIVAWSDYTMAMMQGVVDAGECSYESIVTLDLYKYAPYISLVDYAYPLESFVINTSTWNKLTDEEKQVIEECADETAQWFTDYVKAGWEKDKQTILDGGGTFVEFDKQTFIDKMAPLADQLESEGYWKTSNLYAEIQKLPH